jgi:hypothetical protein
MAEAVTTSKASVNFLETVQLNIPKDCHLSRIEFVKIENTGIPTNYVLSRGDLYSWYRNENNTSSICHCSTTL